MSFDSWLAKIARIAKIAKIANIANIAKIARIADIGYVRSPLILLISVASLAWWRGRASRNTRPVHFQSSGGSGRSDFDLGRHIVRFGAGVRMRF